MKTGQDDRRVKYTKMALRESLIEQLCKKDIAQITVKEICEGADINRATFYAHYADQYDLLTKVSGSLFENLRSYLDPYETGIENRNLLEITERIFEYIKENAKLCKILFSERGDIRFQKRVMSLLSEKIVVDLTTRAHIAQADAGYFFAYIITGCIGAVQMWLDDDMQKSTHFMAEMLVKLTMGSISSYATT